MTIDFARYRSWCLAQGHSLRTVQKSVRYLVHFAEDKGLGLAPELLNEDAVIEFVARCRERGTHPKTLNNYVRELNLWSRFNHLGWKLSYFRRHAPVLMDLLGPDDEDRLRAVRFVDPAVNSRNRAMLLLSLDQGPRRDEMLQMKLSDLVDTPAGGKGVLVRRGKGDRPRLLYLAPETWREISSYVETYRIRSDASALFTARRGPVSYGMMGKLAKDIGRAAGVPNFSWHRGRHRMIDAMLDRGVSLPAIQEVAGHSKAETTVAYASRRALRSLTEREVRYFQKRRFEPIQPRAPVEPGGDEVANVSASSSDRSAGTGI
ncbi:MAG TPA: site-specific integrase [Thermoplasmata archaeon]|nr:site-specific integrase [Thermoplasmata archaeon]